MNVMRISKSVMEGRVAISGAKNSALRLLAASLLSPEKVTLKNYPSRLLDSQVHVEMLEALGKKCVLISESEIQIEDTGQINSVLNWKGRSIRNTLLILGALTARTGYGAVPLPGGCNLGERAYDLHEMLLQRMGATVWEENGLLMSEAPAGGLVGADIHLPIRSTGATENSIITGCLAKGVTRIWNPHIRPEIIDLIKMLNAMGGHIVVHSQEHIEVHGIEHAFNEVVYQVLPDNMEAVTWLVASVMTGGDVEIENFPYTDLEVPMIHLRESGTKYYWGENSLIVRGGKCYPLEISTGPFPGINSDVQPILAAYAACARGESRIIDLRFPGRYAYADEMAKMGLACKAEGNMLRVLGNGKQLQGTDVRALDLRAGAALTLCGMVAEGETRIHDAWQIERGYNNFVKKLRSLGGIVNADADA